MLSESAVQALLEYGADANAKDQGGTPVLVQAVQLKEAFFANKLLEHGADANAPRTDKSSPLITAVELQQLSIVRGLLENGADPDVRKPTGTKQPALSIAVAAAITAIVDALLEYRANVNCTDDKGDTPLHIATLDKHVELVTKLLQAGADPEYRNKVNLTPFVLADDPAVEAAFKETHTDLDAARSQVLKQPRNVETPMRKAVIAAKKVVKPQKAKARLPEAEGKEWPEVFISYRVREADQEAKLLKVALEAQGCMTYVCTTALKNGDDWGTNVSNHLGNCRMMVILGTDTYGAPGTEVMGTWEELQFALRHNLPMYIVKMTGPGGYTEKRTQLLLEPRQVELAGWLKNQAPPDSVVQDIVTRVAKLRAEDTAAA